MWKQAAITLTIGLFGLNYSHAQTAPACISPSDLSLDKYVVSSQGPVTATIYVEKSEPSISKLRLINEYGGLCGTRGSTRSGRMRAKCNGVGTITVEIIRGDSTTVTSIEICAASVAFAEPMD